MPTSAKSENNIPADEPRPWKSGEPYHFALPESKGDCWEVLFKYLYEQDQSQCAAWREEVNNLLIFAGLLSAVVTAFAIETYKTLSPDSDNTIINLLSVIAAHSGNSTDGFTPPPISDPYQLRFAAPSAALNINIFFFASLVLSLSTALIGIVCLQWLTIHQAYPNTLPGRDRLALLNMRMQSFKRWKVPELFSTLPILIQLALVSFFIGLASFLWSIDHTVVVPVAILIGLTLLFLVLTTILPTIQIFLLERLYLMTLDPLPMECPYRSPQAAACRYLFGSSLCSFLFSLALVIPILTYRSSLCIIRYFKYTIRQGEEVYASAAAHLCNYYPKQSIEHFWRWTATMSRCIVHSVDALNSPPGYSQPFKYGGVLHICDESSLPTSRVQTSWVDIGVGWLNIRDILFRHNCGSSSWLYLMSHGSGRLDVERYCDIVHGIKATIFKNTAVTDELIAAAIRCIQTLPGVRSDRFFDTNILQVLHYCSRIFDLFPDIVTQSIYMQYQVPSEAFEDRSIYLLLRLASQSSPAASTLMTETLIRLMGYMCDEGRSQAAGALFTLQVGAPWALYERIRSAPHNVGQLISLQWSINVHSFFTTIKEEEEKRNNIRNGALADPIFQESFEAFMSGLNRPYTVQTQARDAFLSTLTFITNTLLEFIEDNDHFKDDPDTTIEHSFFYCAAFCFWFLDDRWIDVAALRDLRKCLKAYKLHARITPLPVQTGSTIEVGARVWNYNKYDSEPLFSESWWNVLDVWTPKKSAYANMPSSLDDSPSIHPDENVIDVNDVPHRTSNQPYIAQGEGSGSTNSP